MSQKQSTAYVDPSEPESLGGVMRLPKPKDTPTPSETTTGTASELYAA